MSPSDLSTLSLERQRGWKQTMLTVVATVILGGLALLFTGSPSESGDSAAPAAPCPRSAQVEPSPEANELESEEEISTPCGGSGSDELRKATDLLLHALR